MERLARQKLERRLVAETAEPVVHEDLLVKGVVVAPIDVGTVPGGHERDDGDPRERDDHGHGPADEELPDALGRRPRAAEQVDEAEGGKEHPGFDHLRLEGQTDADPGHDQHALTAFDHSDGHCVRG